MCIEITACLYQTREHDYVYDIFPGGEKGVFYMYVYILLTMAHTFLQSVKNGILKTPLIKAQN